MGFQFWLRDLELGEYVGYYFRCCVWFWDILRDVFLYLVTLYEIEKIIDHPKWHPKTIGNDISLLKTKKSIKLNNDILPVCAAEPDNSYVHQKAVVTGWGRTGGKNFNFIHDFFQFITMNVCSSTNYLYICFMVILN